MAKIVCNAYPSRWAAIIASCFGMMCAGTLYVFGLWSESIVTILPSTVKSSGVPASGNIGDDLVEINELFQVALLANYLPFSGFFYSAYGSSRTMLMGAMFNGTGYSILAFAEYSQIRPSWWVLGLAFASLGHGQGYIDAACMGAGLRGSSESSRGTIAGLLKGFYGIAGSVYTLVYLGGLSTKQLLFVLGPINALIVLTSAYFVREKPKNTLEPAETMESKEIELVLEGTLEESSEYVGTWKIFNIVLFAMLIFIMLLPCLLGLQPDVNQLTKFAPLDQDADSWTNDASKTGEIELRSFATTQEPSPSHSEHGETEALIRDRQVQEDGTAASSRNQVARDTQTLGRVLITFEFWSLFSVLAVGMGAGLMVVANFARIVEAKRGTEDERNVLLSIFSISNCLGRIAIGKMSDYAVLRNPEITRPFFLAFVTVSMAVGHIVIGWSSSMVSAYIAIPIVGASYGAFWTLDPTLVTDLFDQELFGKVYGVMSLAPGVGSVLFSTLLTSYVYSLHEDNQVASACLGVECFLAAHTVIAIALLVGTVVSLLLWRRHVKSLIR